MPTTITAYYDFVPGTKAKSSQVDNNFSNHRGTLIPINETTATSSDDTHYLGTSEHQWKTAYLTSPPIVNGETMSSDVGSSYDNYFNFAMPGKTNAYYEYASTAANNPYNYKYDDVKVRMGVEKIVYYDVQENLNFDNSGHTQAPSLSSGGRIWNMRDQYGDQRKDVVIYSEGIRRSPLQYFNGADYSMQAYVCLSGVYTGVNIISQPNTFFTTLTGFYLDGSSTSDSLTHDGNVLNQYSGQRAIRPLRHNLSLGAHIYTAPITNQSHTTTVYCMGFEYVNDSTYGSYPTGVVVLSGLKYTLTGSNNVSWSAASYTGTKGNRSVRYIYESSGIAVSNLTCTSVLEAATLAISGDANTNTISIIQNDGLYLNDTMVRMNGNTSTEEIFNVISSGADNSGTSWTMVNTNASSYTTTSGYVEHYAYILSAADHIRETISTAWEISKFGEGDRTVPDYMSYDFYSNGTYIFANGLTCMRSNNLEIISITGTSYRDLNVSIQNTSSSYFGFTDYMTGCDLIVQSHISIGSAEFLLDGVTAGTIVAQQTKGSQRIRLFSDAPAGTHNLLIVGKNTSQNLRWLTHFITYVPKKPTCSSDEFIEHQEFMRNATHRLFPKGSSVLDTPRNGLYIDQGVIRNQQKNLYFDGSGWEQNVSASYPCGQHFRTSTTGNYVECSFWGTGITLRYYGASSVTYSESVTAEYSTDMSNYYFLSSGSFSGALNVDYYGTVDPFNTNYYAFSTNETSGAVGAGISWNNMPLDYYNIRFENRHSNRWFQFSAIDYHTPIYDVQAHNMGVGGQSSRTRLPQNPNDSYAVNKKKSLSIGPVFVSSNAASATASLIYHGFNVPIRYQQLTAYYNLDPFDYSTGWPGSLSQGFKVLDYKGGTTTASEQRSFGPFNDNMIAFRMPTGDIDPQYLTTGMYVWFVLRDNREE